MRCSISILALVVCLTAPAMAATEQTALFFYSPEFAPGNLSVLTEVAEKYFADSGTGLTFQAFARFEDFRREFTSQRPAFVVIPNWVRENDDLPSGLTPLLLPLRGGQSLGRKTLMARPSITNLRELGHGSVAATMPTVTQARRPTRLEKLREQNPGVRIIAVPKDIDALLAVSFGQVDAAFVSTAQFGMLAAVNPKLTQELHDLGYSEEIPFPRIYATDYATTEEIARFRDNISSVNTTGPGQRLTSLLGYDEWKLLETIEEKRD